MSAQKTYVVSFRANPETIELANQALLKHPVSQCKDHKQFARKILMDYVAGRLVYTNPERDRKRNPALPDITLD